MYFLKQRSIQFSLLVLAIFITLYSVGDSFFLYWFNPRLDLLLNALSGLWVSLLILGLAVYFGQFSNLKDYKVKSFAVAFVSATLIGVIWQLVLNFYHLTNVAAEDYGLRTSIYILTNAIGGTLAHFYFVKRRKNKEKVIPIQYPSFSNSEGVEVR
jgi:hypothetical protein